MVNLNNLISGNRRIVPQRNLKFERKLEMIHLDVTIEASRGQKVCLMGRAGSGASASLLTIREETEIIQGVREVRGDFSTIDLKNPFFINDMSLRSNIILDEVFNRKRYDEVL